MILHIIKLQKIFHNIYKLKEISLMIVFYQKQEIIVVLVIDQYYLQNLQQVENQVILMI